MTCDNCRKKKTCVELCEEAEAYTNQDNKGDDVLTARNYFSFSVATNIEYSDVVDDMADRKKEELVYYFQKIQDMPDSIEKIIIGLIFFGIPVDRIAKYLKMTERNAYYLIEKFHN
jgi:hypothetical protein